MTIQASQQFHRDLEYLRQLEKACRPSLLDVGEGDERGRETRGRIAVRRRPETWLAAVRPEPGRVESAPGSHSSARLLGRRGRPLRTGFSVG